MSIEPPHGADGTAETGAPDPSMEDILASIRRILNEEDAAPAATAEPAAGEAGQAPTLSDPDVLELDHTMLLPDPEPAAPAALPVVPAEPAAPAFPAEPVLAAPLAAPVSAAVELGLVAPAAAAAAAMSVGTLMRTLASERSTQVHRGGPTIEDLVREEIRPLLKEWLDTHLAPMVERLVRTEIERVVSRIA